MQKTMKRRLKQSLATVTAASLLFSFVPVQAKKASKKPVTSIQVKAPLSEKAQKVTTTLTLKKGSTFKLKTSVFPASASKKLVYKSSKKAVASVSSKGKIKAKKVGKATITIQPKNNKKVKAVIKVTVVKKLAKVKKITLDKTTLSLSTAGANRTAQLTATVVSPKKPTTKGFNWFSSDTNVAAVDKNGLVTAKKAGTAQITVTARDGRGAKAVCSVTVTNGGNGDNTNNTATPSTGSQGTPAPTDSSKTPGNNPDASASPSADPGASATPATDAVPSIVVPGERTGIKQGETLQLTAKDESTGDALTDVAWSVNTLEGVSIDNTGLLTVAKTAAAGGSITVTAANSNGSDSAKLTVVENKTPEITDSMVKLNQETATTPLGLTYRSPEAYSTVSDPERGDVIRFDASKGYGSNSYDVLAWMVVDPAYAGKTVTISAYMKYDKIPNVDQMNLVINERWGYKNPAAKYNADPDTWYYISGTYKLPEDTGKNYTGDNNKLYIARDSSHLGSTGANALNAVYYIDDLTFTVLKPAVESVQVTAPGSPTKIAQSSTLQFTASVNAGSDATGAEKAVTWSLDKPVTGVTLSDTGLLTVGENAPIGTEITVKATSVLDATKSASYTLTIYAGGVNSVTIFTVGNRTTVAPGGSLPLSAKVDKTGNVSEDVTWSTVETISGVTLSSDGNNCTLNVGGEVPADTTITVKAVSTADAKKWATKEIKVVAEEEPIFDFNQLKVEYFEDFDGTGATLESIQEAGVLSWQATDSAGLVTATNSTRILKGYGLYNTPKSEKGVATYAFQSFFGSKEDYVQFKMDNTDSSEKTYTLSFMFHFQEIEGDSKYISTQMKTNPSFVSYKLPLKLVSLDEGDSQTTIKEHFEIPFRCVRYSTGNLEYYGISCTVKVPAEKAVRLRLMLDGDLPNCLNPDHTGYTDTPHPCIYMIENVAISSGEIPDISVQKGSDYQLELDTLPTDKVKYYTNCYLAQITHSDEATDCPNFDTIPATVDESGKITALAVGETTLIAEITHEGGEVERRQCIVKVTE
ncbi:MAG: Ig-like domain-containing protein [Lachnospiraceae bacterium]|nr:Ig-like domain-containing protein [Lachnospiraceae bacterium]